jgi:hypothetical protein
MRAAARTSAAILAARREGNIFAHGRRPQKSLDESAVSANVQLLTTAACFHIR